jgi:hypothetical protein
MNEIKLNDILKISDEDLKRTKIRFLITPSQEPHNNPLEIYQENPEKVATDWFLWQYAGRGHAFKTGNIGIGLLKLGKDRWLLVTIKTIGKIKDTPGDGVHYEATELQGYENYFGRIVIKYHKAARRITRAALGKDNLIDDLEILEILSEPYNGDDFPGYGRVSLSWTQLKTIIDRQKWDWLTALKNQKAVYLITDTHTGKQYVGSATSNKGMLLARWSTYIDQGDAGNKRLVALQNQEGPEYIQKYFKYSILEHFSQNTDDDAILARESWWKQILMTKEFGYNAN